MLRWDKVTRNKEGQSVTSPTSPTLWPDEVFLRLFTEQEDSGCHPSLFDCMISQYHSQRSKSEAGCWMSKTVDLSSDSS